MNGFLGDDLVCWLMSWAFVQSREEGRVLASELLEKAHLHPVGPELEKSIKRTASRLAFSDQPSSLYRFVSRPIFSSLVTSDVTQIELSKLCYLLC